MPRRSSRIAVVGNCQAIGLANCLTAMLAGAEVKRSPPNEVSDWRALGASADWVVLQGRKDGREARAAQHAGAKPITFTAIGFAAYHPDIVHATVNSGQLRSGLGPYHSAIALLGWKAGLSASATLKLFNESSFRQLGYFDFWAPVRDAMLAKSRTTDVPLDRLMDRWRAGGVFMHTTNHPQLRVVADIARQVAALMEVSADNSKPEDVVEDHLARQFVLPVYPEIASSLGIEGSYVFLLPGPEDRRERIDLREMIERSFAAYAAIDPSDVRCERFASPTWQELLQDVRRKQVGVSAAPHPYSRLPDTSFWSKAVSAIDPARVDPVLVAPYRLETTSRVATAGSCFAQHIAKALERRGFNHMQVERTSDSPQPPEEGAFSARYGNIYTARQLRQLIDRAFGHFEPSEPSWTRGDGRIVDPFRPRAFPSGFADAEEMLAARRAHLAAVRGMFESVEVFIFTLGLTEAWQAVVDGAVFPLAPGVSGGTFDPARHEFRNFRVGDIVDDVLHFQKALKAVNPQARTILTVSPVPLIATYEQKHVLVSTASSKAKLRAAADEIVQADPSVWYFPSYEIVTGSFNRGQYFAEDLRSVTPTAVEHVMRVFFEHVARGGNGAAAAPGDVAFEAEALTAVVCDEEEIAR